MATVDKKYSRKKLDDKKFAKNRLSIWLKNCERKFRTFLKQKLLKRKLLEAEYYDDLETFFHLNVKRKKK